MTTVAALVAQKHWDYYRGQTEVSTTVRPLGVMSRAGSDVWRASNYHTEVLSTASWRQREARSTTTNYANGHSKRPHIGSTPTMIDLINWGE